MKTLILIAILILMSVPVRADSPDIGSCALEGWTFVDANMDGIRTKGEINLDGVQLRLSTGSTKLSAYGWYGWANLAIGAYSIAATAPNGYRFTTESAKSIPKCGARIIDLNFGLVAQAIPTPIPSPTPDIPTKAGLAIANDVTLDRAKNLGARKVLLYWGTPALVNQTLSLGLTPIVGFSDCNVTPARLQSLATIAKDHPGLTYMYLNEPELKAQSGGTCGAQGEPYDAQYDLSKAARIFAAVSNVVWAFDPSARWIYGNESVALGEWSSRFVGRYRELYGNWPSQTVHGTHLYQAWWLGRPVDNFAGWRDALSRSLSQDNGPLIVTEISPFGSNNPVALFEYQAAILNAEPRVESWFFISWGNALLFDANGNLTELGHAFVEEVSR